MSPEDLIHIVSAYTVPYEGRLIEWGASKATVDVYATRERDERTRQLSVLLSELGLPESTSSTLASSSNDDFLNQIDSAKSSFSPTACISSMNWLTGITSAERKGRNSFDS